MANYLIVGGSSGIGRSLVELLFDQGHNIWVWSRTKRDLPESINFTAVDVTSDNELPKTELPDQLDGVAYCPGSIDLRSFRSLKPDAFRSAFELNVVGAVRCIQAAERALKRVNKLLL